MRLALALLEAGLAEEAARNYEKCLKGPFASDLEIKWCAARAFAESGRHVSAITHLEDIRAADPNFRAEQVSVLIARTLAAAGRSQDAKSEFEAAENRFGSFEVRAEYAISHKTASRPRTGHEELEPAHARTQYAPCTAFGCGKRCSQESFLTPWSACKTYGTSG